MSKDRNVNKFTLSEKKKCFFFSSLEIVFIASSYIKWETAAHQEGDKD